MSEPVKVESGWVRAVRRRGRVAVGINSEHEGHSLLLSVEEAVQFSRMIVKAAAEAAGLETASEALSGADPTGDTGTP